MKRGYTLQFIDNHANVIIWLMDNYFGGDSHNSGRLVETWISELPEDSLVLKLLNEIAKVIDLPLTPCLSGPPSMVLHYLLDYRVRRPISKRSIDAIPFPKDFMLTWKIKALHDTEIYCLCQELAIMAEISIETVMGKTLYIFLDQSLAYILLDQKKKKRKRKPPELPGYSIS